MAITKTITITTEAEIALTKIRAKQPTYNLSKSVSERVLEDAKKLRIK